MSDPRLILVLMQYGIDPTPEAVQKLYADLTDLASILIDHYIYKMCTEETLKNARIGLAAQLLWVVETKRLVRKGKPRFTYHGSVGTGACASFFSFCKVLNSSEILYNCSRTRFQNLELGSTSVELDSGSSRLGRPQ